MFTTSFDGRRFDSKSDGFTAHGHTSRTTAGSTRDRTHAPPTDQSFSGLPERDTGADAATTVDWRESLRRFFNPATTHRSRSAPPTSTRRLPGDPLQAAIEGMLNRSALRARIFSICELLDKLRGCTQAEVIALPMAVQQDALTRHEHLHREAVIAFMPRLVATLLAYGLIEREQASLARAAAGRVSAYASLPCGVHTGRLRRAAVDPAWLEARLEDPCQWRGLVRLRHHLGVLTQRRLLQMEKEIFELARAMEAIAFLPPDTAALLRRRIPDLLEECRRENQRFQGVPPGPGPERAAPPPPPPPLPPTPPPFDAAALQASLELDEKGLRSLHDGLRNFFHHGSVNVEGAQLVIGFGAEIGDLLRDSERTRTFMLHLRKQLAGHAAPQVQAERL